LDTDSLPKQGTKSPDPHYGAGTRLVYFDCHDPQTGLTAFQLLIPSGWQTQGGIQWVNNHLSPARAHLVFTSPNGPEAIEIFPGDNFGFTSDPMMQMSIPRGGNFYGAEFLPPHNGLQAVQAVILPRYRQIPNIEIVNHELAPDLTQKAMQGVVPSPNSSVWAEGFRVLVRYSLQEQPMLEEIAGAITCLQLQTPSMMGMAQTVYWATTLLLGGRSTEDRFEHWRPIFRKSLASVNMNPQWVAIVKQITQQMGQGVIANVRQMGQAAIAQGKQLSQMSDMIYEQGRKNSQAMDAAHDNWRARQDSQDRVHDQWVHTIRGTEEFFDPNKGQNVELDSSYKQVWSNASGEYILSDDVLFDPNVGSTTNWTKLDPGR
jgi:hypothetical protein